MTIIIIETIIKKNIAFFSGFSLIYRKLQKNSYKGFIGEPFLVEKLFTNKITNKITHIILKLIHYYLRSESKINLLIDLWVCSIPILLYQNMYIIAGGTKIYV